MARAAYAGDSQGFLEQYQEALQAAREAGKTDPEQSVIDSYKRRSLRTGVTKTVMTDAEWSLLMSVLSEEDRAKVMNAVSAHEHYLRLIGGTRRVQSINRTIGSINPAPPRDIGQGTMMGSNMPWAHGPAFVASLVRMCNYVCAFACFC